MKGKIIRIVCVGKIKTPWWRDACAHYVRLIGHWRPLECVETKDAGGEPGERNEREGRALIEKLGKGELVMALCENGELLDSPGFANILRSFDNDAAKRLNFIIGGPYGLDGKVLARCARKLSLSPMTWTHELARVLLLEQIYRSESILRGLPYHH